MCVLLLGCGDDSPTDGFDLSDSGPTQGSFPVQSDDDGATRVASCDDAKDGTPCGEPGQSFHCIFDACVRNACGDGIVLARDREECDDGNERDHDGCSAVCKKEQPPACGNGEVEPGEVCDDGNTSDDDRCTAACKDASCGDGVLSAGEECDDGNASDRDECTRACRDPKSSCGNRTIELDEACDDGNDDMDDGCHNDCTLPDTDAGDSGSGGSAGANGASGSAAAGEGGSGGAGSGGAGAGGAGVGAAGAGGAGVGGAGVGGAGESGQGGEAGDDEDGGMAGDGGQGGEGGTGGSESATGIAHALPGCAECRTTNCTDVDFSGINALDRCFMAPDGSQSPARAQLCVDVLNCAFEEDCAFESTGLNGCWCTATPEICQSTAGLDQNHGVCFDEILAASMVLVDLPSATRFEQLDAAIIRLSQEPYPSGAAFWMVQCDRSYCASAEVGDCTP